MTKSQLNGLITSAVLASLVTPAFAQTTKDSTEGIRERVDGQNLLADKSTRDRLAKPKLPSGKMDDKGEIETSAASGCILSQTYNTQSVDDFSVQFRISTSDGPVMFNVLTPNIKRADPASFPLANAEQTQRWTRLLDTFERAAASDRPVTVSYAVGSRNVFGITIEWSGKCSS